MQQINTILHQLTLEEYCHPLSILNQSTIGQHIRHVIEFFVQLEQGYKQSLVNYDYRNRNKILETDKDAAIAALTSILAICEMPDKELKLAVNNAPSNASFTVIDSTFYRELAFAVEHTVHHMAILRIGLNQFRTVSMPENFGVATSTQLQQTRCVQ